MAPVDSKAARSLAKIKLAESGITTAQAKNLRMKALVYKDILKLYPSLPESEKGRPGIEIMYHDTKGHPTGHARIRYLGPGLGFNPKPLRYAQPKGSGVHIYWTPVTPWGELLPDPQYPLWVTEGEFKAACANLNMLPCIGLGGVNMYTDGKGNLHPDLKAVSWEGRFTYIAYDSDSVGNPDVRNAETKLAQALLDLGAVPYIVRLPKLPEGKKTGLDDYLVAKGVDALTELAKDAEPFAASKALHELARKVIYIHEANVVLEYATGFKMPAQQFVTVHYRNLKHVVSTLDPNGKPRVQQKYTAQEFIEWPSRPQLRRFTFAPGKETVLGDEYNLWLGRPVEPGKGDVSLWHKLLDNVFMHKSKATREWFEKWVAYPFQHPGSKLKQAVLMWGGEGVGKSFVGEIIMSLYAPHSTKFDNVKLNSPYNSWADSMEFAVGEEIVINTIERGAVSEMLKTLVTDPVITINQKYLKPYDLPNCMNLMIVSNHSVPLKLAPDDRRYFVVMVTAPPLDKEVYVPLDAWAHSDEGKSALLYYFLNLDLTGFDPNARAPETADKAAMIEGGSTLLEDWVRRLRTAPETVLVFGQRTYNYSLVTAEELLVMFKATPDQADSKVTKITMANALLQAKFLKAYPHPIRTATGGKHLYVIKNVEALLKTTPGQLGKVYDSEHADPIAKYAKEKK